MGQAATVLGAALDPMRRVGHLREIAGFERFAEDSESIDDRLRERTQQLDGEVGIAAAPPEQGLPVERSAGPARILQPTSASSSDLRVTGRPSRPSIPASSDRRGSKPGSSPARARIGTRARPGLATRSRISRPAARPSGSGISRDSRMRPKSPSSIAERGRPVGDGDAVPAELAEQAEDDLALDLVVLDEEDAAVRGPGRLAAGGSEVGVHGIGKPRSLTDG